MGWTCSWNDVDKGRIQNLVAETYWKAEVLKIGTEILQLVYKNYFREVDWIQLARCGVQVRVSLPALTRSWLGQLAAKGMVQNTT
jgi:hypothetical protein